MHMFKKHDQSTVPPEPRGQDISAPFQTSNAKSPSAYGASRFPITHSPTVDDRSPGAYARRSILRNSHGPVPGASSMPAYSYAASPQASFAHGGSMTFIPASPSSPAFYPGLNAVTSTWNHAEARQSGIPATMSLPQMAPHAQEHCYGGPVSPRSTNALPNPYESSFASSVPTRASVPCIVRPLNVRKNPPFPFPSEAAALHTLARVLRTETKKFRITDFIDIEEGEFAALVEAKEREKGHDVTPYVHRMQMQDPRMRRKSMWDGEEETETVMDCVRDKMDDEGGGASRWKSERMERSEKRRREREMRFKDLHLFGTHLEDLPDFALSPVIIGGYLHEVPTAVAAAIEELVISRLNEPNFFNSRPDRTQLFELVSRFDQLVTANASHGRLVPPPSLSNESTQSIYSLLVTYLSALPHAIIPRPLVDALWCWCVSPSVTRAQRARIVRNDPEASESEHETSEEEEDHVNYAERLRQREREFLDLPSFRVQVRVARHLLLLLSRRQFSLLVYLMTFIRAVLRLDGDSDKEGDQTSSGVALHDIARAFGGVLLGGRDWKKRSSIKYRDGLPVNGDRDRTSKEQKIMTWLVNHWGRIASAYELDEGPGEKFGQGSRPRATSMPVKGPEPTRSSLDEQHNNGKSKASGQHHKGSCLSQVVSSVRDEREESKQNPSGQLNRLPSSECESLTSGDTAGSACSSDWEELPIVSAHPTHSNGKILSLPKDGKTEPGQQVLSTLLARQAEEEDILEYYNGDSRGHTSGMSASEGDCGNADLDDDSSVYSNDNALQEHQSRDLADQRSAKQDCTEKTAAAAEIYALRKQLRQALDERDQARKVVDDMRVVVDRARV